MQAKTPLDQFMEQLRQRGASSKRADSLYPDLNRVERAVIGGPVPSYPCHVHILEANSASDWHLKRDAKRDRPVTLPDALADRVRVFQEQLQAWTGSGIPLLTLPGSPEPQQGRCVSCGVSITTGWRCPLCLEAVYRALGVTPPEAVKP